MSIADQIALEQRLSTYTGEDRVESAQVVLDLYRKDKGSVGSYKVKIPTLDRILNGVFCGQLIVISGVTGQGKTTLVQTISLALLEQLAYPLWFSYEVDCEDFLSVFPGDYKEHVYMPSKLQGNTLQWIEERMLESKLKFDTKAVFIDHLHYLISMNPKQNASLLIGETVRGLKQLALKHRVVVFLVAHMQKTKPDEEPGLGHIRDSSFVEQEADTVLYVWRQKENKSVTVLKVAKNRKRGIIDDRIPLVLKDGRYYEKAGDKK
jgi:replicative DNA helicase